MPIIYKYYPNYFIYVGLHSSLTYFVNREAKNTKITTGSVPVRSCAATGRRHTSTLVSTLIRPFIYLRRLFFGSQTLGTYIPSVYAVGSDI